MSSAESLKAERFAVSRTIESLRQQVMTLRDEAEIYRTIRKIDKAEVRLEEIEALLKGLSGQA